MLRRYTGLLIAALALALLIILPQSAEAQSTFGTNWTGQFFTTTNFTGIFVTSSYPAGMNFNWPGVPTTSDGVTPVPGFVQSDNFSARFTSAQAFAATGTYQFTGFADDQLRVFIDGIEVHNQTLPGRR